MSKNKEQSAIVPIDQYAVMQFSTTDLTELIRENLMGENLGFSDLVRVKMPSGGNTFFSVPDMDGEEKPVQELVGVILYSHQHRGFWASSVESGGQQAPDCRSADAHSGAWNPDSQHQPPDNWTGDCLTCPYAQFGSNEKTGRGQACKLMHRLFILEPDKLLPTILNLSPTSLKPFRSYRTALTNNGIVFYSGLTGIGLEREKNAEGTAYSRAVFRFKERLSGEAMQKMLAYRSSILPVLQAFTVSAEDFGGGSSAE